MLQVTNWWEHCQSVMLQWQYQQSQETTSGGYPYKAQGGALAATEKVSECHRQNWLNSQVFHYKECTEVAATMVFSWLDLPLHITILCKSFKRYRFLIYGPYSSIVAATVWHISERSNVEQWRNQACRYSHYWISVCLFEGISTLVRKSVTCIESVSQSVSKKFCWIHWNSIKFLT